MHGGLAARHHDAGLCPKVLSEGICLGRIGARLIIVFPRAWL